MAITPYFSYNKPKNQKRDVLELVYLWVEDYKNIQKQGFNFSPRFHCKYDEDKNELTIDENDDYIEKFFGENINVTAIVGKNGSGKSRLLTLIREISVYSSWIIFKNYEEFMLIDLFSRNGIKIKLPKGFRYRRINDWKNKKTFLENTVIPYFDYSFTNNLSDYKNILKPIYPNKEMNIVDLSKEELENQSNILKNFNFLKEKNQLSKFKDFFQPYQVLIRVNLGIFKKDSKFLLKKEIEKKVENLEKKSKKEVGLSAIKIFKKLSYLLSDIDSYKSGEVNFGKDDFEEIEANNELLQIREKYKIGNEDYSLEQALDNWEKNIEEGIIEKNLLKENETKDFEDHKILKFNINDLNLNDIELILEEFSYRQFNIELIDINNKKLNNLSFGEQQLLKILNQILILVYDKYEEENQETYEIINYEVKNFIILLDEIDIGFHPNWQKQIVKYIIDFLRLIPNKNFHLIFTTHSPFLLSDIPRENIIFLNEKYPKTKEEEIRELKAKLKKLENG